MQYSALTISFRMFLQKWNSCFLETVQINWESLFCANLLKKGTRSIYGIVHDIDKKIKNFCSHGDVTSQCPKKKRSKLTFPDPKPISNFHCQTIFTSFSYQRAVSLTRGLKSYCFLRRTFYLWAIMWILANIKTGLYHVFGQKVTANTWILSSNCSRETTTKFFTWSKFSKRIVRFQRSATEETTSPCSWKLCQRGKNVRSADTYIVQRQGWTTQSV